MIKTYDLKKLIILALKIALGSSLAIYIAEETQLQFAASAGSIALLTMLTTKLETFRLSLYRLITFGFAAFLSCIVFTHIKNDWTAYGVFIFITVILSYLFGYKATLSVNAVIGTHFLSAKTIDAQFLFNELLIVIIGIVIAIIMNLFHDYRGDRRNIRRNMRDTEERLRMILETTAKYLSDEETTQNVWQDIHDLESDLNTFIKTAYEYQENTFHSHPQYYIDYFNMRLSQCKIIHSLHHELKQMRTMPMQAQIVSEYILYLKEHVVEINHPYEQLERLRDIVDTISKDSLPTTQNEFRAQSMLYHIMMDLEEFLKAKKRFVDKLDEKQLNRYWRQRTAPNN